MYGSTSPTYGLFISPGGIVFFVVLGAIAGVWGHQYGASVSAAFALMGVLGRTERRHAELKEEIAALRAQLAAAGQPGRDQAPDEG